jgi:excisionase family DNA binding protein
MERASSAERATLDVLRRPGGGLGEPGPSGSPKSEPSLVGATLLRPEEVAKALQIGRTRTFELLGSGELPVLRIGRIVRVPKADLDRWIAEHTTVREPGY